MAKILHISGFSLSTKCLVFLAGIRHKSMKPQNKNNYNNIIRGNCDFISCVTTLRSTCSPAGGGVLPGERGDRTPLLPVHHLIMERIKQWTQTLICTSSRGLTASGGVTSFANLYLFTAHTNLSAPHLDVDFPL